MGSGNLVAGNRIGTNVAGTAALANGFDGVGMDTSASLNTIGGTTAAARNVLSGNTSSAVEINAANIVARCRRLLRMTHTLP